MLFKNLFFIKSLNKKPSKCLTSPAPLPEITRELEEILTNGKDAFGSIDILIRAVANFYFFTHELDLRGAKNFGIVAQDILTKYPALSIATVNIAKKQNAAQAPC